ncbi:MAG: dihydroorotate dehydrogenase [Porphyromonas sp.]|nr:dihydroorotate dehydrogenase [Porphyromonas sp.]
MKQLEVEIGKGLKLKNPVTVASGTFGEGLLMSNIYDVGQLGAIFAKGTTLEPREGNPPQRMAETYGGMLNAVGLQNKGIEYFCNELYPRAIELGTEIIPNISGSYVSDYVEVAARVNELEKIHAVEINVSCPNVKEGGMAFGTTREGIEEVVSHVRDVCDKTMIVKLSPNVTDIADIARAAEASGADAVSLVNTFLGMAVDVRKQRPVLSTITGGLSGPCIKPIALRMVWQVANAVSIPVIGLGGIRTWEDAVEFLLCGASAIQVGTYNFVDPLAPLKIIEGIKQYMEEAGVEQVSDLIGTLEI